MNWYKTYSLKSSKMISTYFHLGNVRHVRCSFSGLYMCLDTLCFPEFERFSISSEVGLVSVIFKNIKLNWLSDIAFLCFET
jgi:hypothetical protein